MNFLALVLTLALERLIFRLANVRRVALLGAYARYVAGRLSGPGAGWHAALYAAIPALAVALLAAARPSGPAYVLYAAFVLWLALGPDDLHAEASEYVAAAHANRAEAATLAADLVRDDACQRAGAPLSGVAEAVLVQANNRIFGVLFWFMLLGPFGPVGAVLFRVTDVLRRAALAEATVRGVAATDPRALGLQRLHGILSFVPARLLALTYGVAGSFEDAFRGWRGYLAQESAEFFAANDLLLLHGGQGALGSAWRAAGDDASRTELALGLVRRSLYVWLAVLAILALATDARW